MAVLYSDTVSYTAVRLNQTDDEELIYGQPPGTLRLEFDAETNLATVADMITYLDRYSYDGAQLRRSGQLVTLAPPTPEFTYKSQWNAIFTDLSDYLALGSPTNAQTIAAFRQVIRVLWYIAKILRKRGLV